VKTAVIAIPAEFSMEQRRATLEAYALAGIKVQRVLEEPTAAALAYGLDEKEGVEYVLVYDFGGGTLDVSLLRMGQDGFVDVMGSAGDNALGGADFDALVSHFLMDRFHEAVDPVRLIMNVYDGKQEDDLVNVCASTVGMEASLCTSSAFHTMAERMKIRLSDVDNDLVSETCLTISDEFTAAISNAGTSSQTTLPPIEQVCQHFVPKTISLTRNEFNTVSQPLFDRAVLPIRNVLEEQDMSKEDIDEVVMVGGTTRMPHIRELVKQELGIEKLNVEIDPDLTVAYGAASVID
jgi:molecular chaperone DnaK (HSP70)